MLMKGIVLWVLLLPSAQSVFSQSHFYYGSWNTSNPNKTAIINASSNSNNQVYRIGASTQLDDGVIDEYELYVDGQKINTRFIEKGGVIVEGKRIEIRQIGNSPISKGYWEVIQKPKINRITNTWSASPTLNTEVLVAEFKTAQEFNFALNNVSLGCSQELVEVFVDGVAIKDASGRVVQFGPDTNFTGKGKKITIKTYGICGNNSLVTGSIILKEPVN
jgi:hypothetical protein